MTKDKLEVMMQMQRTLQEAAYGYDFNDMDPKQRVLFIKEMSIHIGQELNEMLYELPYFKPWKDYSGMTELDVQEAFEKARKELIDMWHFFMNTMIALNMGPDEVYAKYTIKNAENYQRQIEGYTHDKSYREIENAETNNK